MVRIPHFLLGLEFKKFLVRKLRSGKQDTARPKKKKILTGGRERQREENRERERDKEGE